MPNIGKYEIESRIGHGGMGDVYRAFDPTLRRRVAIKVLKLQGDTENLNRFRLEATSAGNLNHPNIVTIHDYGDFEGEPFIVMEYLEGLDLQRTIDSGKKFDLVEITDIMSQVADALECAHQAGVIHRDVKPANIMLLNRGGVKLMDFGIARLAGANTQQTKAGHLIGTVLYMSPEQFHNLELDRRVDIWAYGVIYYQLLAGKHPFAVQDQIVTMYNIANKAAPPICSINQEVPEALGQIVDRCLAKDRDQRYATMEDLRFDVMPVLQDLSRQQAARMIGEARKLIDSGDWDTAQSIVKRVLELDPADRSAVALRKTIADALRKREAAPRLSSLAATAEKHIGAREFPKALEALDTALKIDPTHEDLRARAAEVRELIEREKRAAELLQAARQDLATEHFTGAYQNATEALRYDPNRPEAVQLLASVQQEIEKRDREKRLREALEKSRSLLGIGSFDEAIPLLQEIIVNFPGTLEASQMLREAEAARDKELRNRRLRESLTAVKEMLRLKRFQEAVQRLEALTVEFPGEDEVIQMLRYAREEWKVRQRVEALDRIKSNIAQLQREGRFDEAIRLLDRSQAEFPAEPDLLRLAQAVNAAKAEAERRAALERVVLEAQGKKQSGEITEAIRLLDLGLQQHGPDERLLGVREQLDRDWRAAQRNQAYRKVMQEGREFAGRREWEKAISHYQQIVRQYPEEAEPRALLAEAEASFARERRERAEKDALSKAAALESQNQRESALAEVDAVLRFYPESAVLAEAKARLQKEIAEARKTQERELKLLEARRKAEEEQRRRAQELEEKAREQQRQISAKVEDALAKAYLALGQGDLGKASKMIAEAGKIDASHPGLERARNDLRVAQELANRQTASRAAQPAAGKPAGLPVAGIAIGAVAAVAVLAGAFFYLHKAPDVPLEVTPQSAQLAFTIGEAPPNPMNLSVSGSGSFHATASDPWISVAPDSGNLPATLVLSGKMEGLKPGDYRGSVDISAGQALRHVTVSLTVAPANVIPPVVEPNKPDINKPDTNNPPPTQPEINISPENVTVSYQAGSPDPAPRLIYVYGKGHFQASVRNPQWVAVNPADGAIPGSISLGIHPGQLPLGSYATQLVVTTPEAPAVKKFASIRLTVTAAAKPEVKEVPPVVNPPVVNPPEPVKCSSEGYLGRRIGDMVWNGTLAPNGKLVITSGTSQAGGGSLVGPSFPKLACFDVSGLPAGVRSSTSAGTLTLTNASGAPVTSITIHWMVR
jgi:serine/threonine-protein kinase